MNKAKRQIERQLALIRSIDPESIIAPDKRYRYSIKDLKTGGVYRLADHTYLVKEIGIYTETDEAFQKELDWTGHELKVACLETGTTHNLEWEEDDEIDVSLTLAEIKFHELKYDDGKPIAPDSDDLDEIVEKNWEIIHGDKSYFPEDDYAARFVRNGGNKKENVYFYEFEAEDGDQLTIEVWVQENGKEEFQVFLSKSVPPDDIEVIAAGSAAGG